jgi:hypothetical protein
MEPLGSDLLHWWPRREISSEISDAKATVHVCPCPPQGGGGLKQAHIHRCKIFLACLLKGNLEKGFNRAVTWSKEINIYYIPQSHSLKRHICHICYNHISCSKPVCFLWMKCAKRNVSGSEKAAMQILQQSWGSIPSRDSVQSEGWQMKQWWIKLIFKKVSLKSLALAKKTF